MIEADDVADTLRLLAPGFIALKIFYQYGLRTKRTDLEWTLWSVLAAFVIAPIGPWLTLEFSLAIDPIWLALLVGVASGIALTVTWRLVVYVWPRARVTASSMAWDAVLAQSQWLQVGTSDGRTISGSVRIVADPVETEDPDLYVLDPAWVDAAGQVQEMQGVTGLLIARDKINYIQTFGRDPAA